MQFRASEVSGVIGGLGGCVEAFTALLNCRPQALFIFLVEDCSLIVQYDVFTRGYKGTHLAIVLEAVGDQYMWI